MSTQTWNDVDGYIAQTMIAPDPVLDEALAGSERAGLPAISVSPPQGKLLHLIAKAVGARNILEIGTLGGYSGIWLARSLPPGGKLITLEVNEEYAKIARGNFARAGVGSQVDIRVAPALTTLAELAQSHSAQFDLTFIDADKVSYPEYMEYAIALTRVGGVILADNVVREGAVVEASSTDAAVQAVRRMNESVSRDPRISATIIQTVGVKGYDGLLVGLVTGDG